MIFKFIFIAAAASETEILRSVFWLLGWGAASQQSLLGCCEPVLAHLRVRAALRVVMHREIKLCFQIQGSLKQTSHSSLGRWI